MYGADAEASNCSKPFDIKLAPQIEEVVAERARIRGEHAVLALRGVCAQHAQAGH